MVVFVDQMSELLDLALEKYHSLSEVQREELAAYIIPEVREGPMYIYTTKAFEDVPRLCLNFSCVQ